MIAIFLESKIGCFHVSDDQAESFMSRLAEALPVNGLSCVRVCRSEEEFIAVLPDAIVAIVWTFRQEWFAFSPRLRAIFTPAAGKDYFRITPPAGVSLHYGAFHGAIMGETALACVLAMSHGILPFAREMSVDSDYTIPDLWPRTRLVPRSRRIAGSTILILGFGSIGRRFAEMVAPLGLKIVGVTQHQHPELETVYPFVSLATMEELDMLLPSADHVVCFLPSGAATDDIIDVRRLSLMKKGAFLYNFGRGNAIDEKALVDALASGHICGAVLDVFKTEPLPSDSPLRRAPNCWLYPHASAFSPDYLDLYFASIVDEISEIIA